MASVFSAIVLFGHVLTMIASIEQRQAPPLDFRITASNPQELYIDWDPPADVTDLKHYTVRLRDVMADTIWKAIVDANTTSHRLTDLMANGSYSVQVTWTGATGSSVPWTRTVRPMEVYQAGLEKRKRPPATLIFYSIIAFAVTLYFIVVSILVCYMCRKRRGNRSSFSVNLGPLGKFSSLLRATPADSDTLGRYSRTEDLPTNRVSTFTGLQNNAVKPSATIGENGGYERPFSIINYLHPLPEPLPEEPLEEPPPLPERSAPCPDEHHYEMPDNQLYTPPKQKPKRSIRNKLKGTDHDPLEYFPSTPPVARSATMRRDRSINTVPDTSSKCMTWSKAKSHSSRSDGSSTPVPTAMKSSASVSRNESMRSVTIRTEVDNEAPASCPNVIGKEFLEAAAEDGFQITFTLSSKPKPKQASVDSSYIYMK